MLSSNEQDIDDGLTGPFLLDGADKDNNVFFQYLTGDNLDTKINDQESGSDADDSSDDENEETTYTYTSPQIPVEVPQMIPIQHAHLLEQQQQVHHQQQQFQRHHLLQQHQVHAHQAQAHHHRQLQQQVAQQQQAAAVAAAQQQVQQSGESSSGIYHPDDSQHYPNKRLKWTPQMDKLLKEGFEKHQGHGVGMWKKIADHVSQGMGWSLHDGNRIVSNHQCGERYKHHLDPALETRKAGTWTDEDVELLRKLVAENTSHDENGQKKKTVINWVKISISLNRHYRDCQHKWINMVKSELKTGVFTKDEEELLLRRVQEWGDRGKGIWVTLEKELGRRNRSILDKYRRLVKKKTS